MNKENINIDLKGVPQTLLLPLFGRALFSQGENPPIRDTEAINLVQTLNYDFKDLARRLGNSSTVIWWVARAYNFDEAIKNYLQRYPEATVVNLGAGLDTTFYRVNNGKLTWVDLDLPEVTSLRKKLLSKAPNVHLIEKSVLDYSWMDEVKKFGDHIIFFAGGLFMYFNEEQVKSLFLEMANRFPQSELIFDTIQTKGLKPANKLLRHAKMGDAVLTWGLDYGKALEAWSPKIKLIAQTPFFKNIKANYNFSFLNRIKMFFSDFNKKGGMIHLKFIQK